MTEDQLTVIREAAKARGFDVETTNGWTRAFHLEENEIAFVCNRCGSEVKTTLTFPAILHWISQLECPRNVDCIMETDERELTANGSWQWCVDCYGIAKFIIRCMKYATSSDVPEHAFLYEIEDIDKAFFVVDNRKEEISSPIIFLKCNYQAKARFIMLRLRNITFSGSNLQCNSNFFYLWSAFEQELYNRIEQQIKNTDQERDCLNGPLKDTLDCYFSIAKELSRGIVNIWESAVRGDQCLYKYIRQHTCPVCGMLYTSKESSCSNCGFSEMQRAFINIDEGLYWKNHTIPEYRRRFFNEHFNVLNGTVTSKKIITDFRSIIIPSGITVLAEKSFAKSNKLENVVCPEGLQAIEEDAFDACYNLKHISMPTSLKIIGPRAFNYTDINSMRLPEGLASVGEEAFWSCNKLEYIVIPTTVTSMGSNVFGGCRKLLHIFCESNSKPDGWDQNWVCEFSDKWFHCSADVHWGDEWHYDEEGNPVIN